MFSASWSVPVFCRHRGRHGLIRRRHPLCAEPDSRPLVQGDVRKSPFGKTFQVIGIFDVLEHIPE